jgi:hypothetical protein
MSAKSFSVVGTKTHESVNSSLQGYVTKWYAIGVGEEDTTLRDSLASILQEEGVSVTEEDDMASLISKVDEEFNNNKQNLTTILSNKGLNVSSVNNINELINYINELGNYTPSIVYLYNEGDECNDVTNGWTNPNEASSTVSLTKSSDKMILKASAANSSQRHCYAISNNIFCLSDYNKLFIEYDIEFSGSMKIGFTFGVGDFKSNTSLILSTSVLEGPVTRKIDMLDISSITTSGYIVVRLSTESGEKIALTSNVYRIWLEK